MQRRDFFGVAAARRRLAGAESFGSEERSPVIVPSARIMHYLNERGLNDVSDPTTPTPEAADAQGRSSQRFTMAARVRRGEAQRQALASGQDIYAVTAPLIGEAVERLLSGPKPSAGVHAPGAVFDAQAFLQALAPVFTALECREESAPLTPWSHDEPSS